MILFILCTTIYFISLKITYGCLPTQNIEATPPPVASPCSVCLDIYKPNCIENDPGTCLSASAAGLAYVIGPVYYSYSADADTCSAYLLCPTNTHFVVRKTINQEIVDGQGDHGVEIDCQQTTGPNPGLWFWYDGFYPDPFEIDAITCIND